ncbi:MFS transporter [Fodinicola acaciae]|uniref:MFS transporter n=1 Tax=Fodinicola acaciae TaxID=2681555 RepID=UPI0013D4796F|nr:MFS transporter [Fodinicola acaciae]
MATALQEATTPATGGWIAKWTFASFGWLMPYYAAAQVLLPKQADQVAGNSREAVIGVVTVVASVVTIVVNIAVGAWSDRTLHRRGRRQVWVLGGTLVTGVFLAAQGFQTTVVGMVLVWALVQVGLSMSSAALSAAIPDDVPVNQRAFVSAFWGVSSTVGPLIGIALVSLVLTEVLPGFLGIAILAVLLSLPFAFGTRGVPLTKDQRPPFSLRRTLIGIVEPLRHRDFSWAWSGRFFIQLSNALIQVYLYYLLQDRLHVDPQLWTLILVGLYTVFAVAAAIPAGRWSDRTMRRKRLVVIAAVLQGLAGLVFACFTNLPSAIVAAIFLGLGWGAYSAVDQALITQVLPKAEHRGKDLGIINIANNLPYVFAGAIGGLVLSLLGRDQFGYPTIYVLAVVAAIISALTVQPIKSVQ